MNDTIIWDENDIPTAKRFDDPYYSRQNGRAETGHVFINGNELSSRWILAGSFHIAELGFGTGLNFLETLFFWEETAPADHHLIYTSFELYPLPIDNMMRALRSWPDLIDLAIPFLKDFSLDPGWHTATVGRITLVRAIGDANQCVPEMTRPANAWYLDGFSPAKNPELWNPDLMHSVGEKTVPNGTFSTYTSAGWVRRMMQDAGFDVQRVKGYDTKRHMTIGKKR